MGEFRANLQNAIACFQTACEFRRAEMALLEGKPDEIPKELKCELEGMFTDNMSHLQVLSVCCIAAVRFQDSGISILEKNIGLEPNVDEILAKAIKDFRIAKQYRRADLYKDLDDLQSLAPKADPEEEIPLEEKKKIFEKATIHQQAGILILQEVMNFKIDDQVSENQTSEMMA